MTPDDYLDFAYRTVVEAARLIAASPAISAKGCMEHAVMTSKDKISADARRRLRLLIEEQLGWMELPKQEEIAGAVLTAPSDVDRLQHVQGTLRCGTHCGSCIPELRALVNRERKPVTA